MAPSPTIPTSFVPKQPVRSAARFSNSGGNIFLVLSLFVLGLVLAGALGVFLYGKYLTGVEKTKAEELDAAQKAVNSESVEDFIRARDRFSEAQGLLDRHVSVSRFFDVLESITLVNVRFDSFSYFLLPGGSGEITLTGAARSFNALAAQSNAFSSEKYIKRAIFSGIQVTDSGTVRFSVAAEIDPKLLEFVVSTSTPVTTVATTTLPVATTTAATTSAATTTSP